MKVLFSPILLLLICANSYSGEYQNLTVPIAIGYTKEQTPWRVTSGGIPIELPFLGGFNDPKPSLLDFNHDGLTDLFVGQIDGSLLYLMNTGTSSIPRWTPVQERLGGVDIGTWHTFCDIDGDGDFDSFCDSRSGKILFYRNQSSGNNIIFQLADTAFSSFKNGGDSALQTGSNNTPAFADIDNDGDFDYFFGAISGKLEFHRNVGDSINYSFVFETDFYDSVLAFPIIKLGLSEQRHGLSYINFADIDSDNDLDLFFGDIFNRDVYFFRNDGTSDSSDLNFATQDFLDSATTDSATTGFNHPVVADLDGDNGPDIVLGVAQLANLNNLRFLRNQGGLFVEETQNLISQIDIGTESVPALGDLDADGDIDMLVGGSNGQLQYFENTGTAFNPAFNKLTDTFGGIDVGGFSAPVLVDWDNDYDLDLLIGNFAGKIEYWRNDGNASNFVPTLVTRQITAIIVDTLPAAGIKVDAQAVPFPADLDGDGLTDLVLGEWDLNGLANILLYKNTGAIGNPVLTRVTNRFIKVLDQNGDTLFRDFTIPAVYDWDGDGKKDLILGGRYGGLTLYANSALNSQFPDSLTLSQSAADIPGTDAGQYLAIAFADIDNDNDDDIFAGEESGGVNFYRKLSSSCCKGSRGDVNNDGADGTILDLNFMVDDIFRGGPAPACRDEGDLNNDGTPSTVLDLTYMINNIFRGGPNPPICP